MSDFRRHLENLMKDPEFAVEYKALEVQYAFARQVIEARAKLGWTQTELAKKVGTSQANISKIEHAEMNPTIELMNRIAQGLDMQLQIMLTEKFPQESDCAGFSDIALTQTTSWDSSICDEQHYDVADPFELGYVA